MYLYYLVTQSDKYGQVRLGPFLQMLGIVYK